MSVGRTGTAPPPSGGLTYIGNTTLQRYATEPPHVVVVPVGNNTFVNRTVIAPNAHITFNNFTTVIGNTTLETVGGIGRVTAPTTPGIIRLVRNC